MSRSLSDAEMAALESAGKAEDLRLKPPVASKGRSLSDAEMDALSKAGKAQDLAQPQSSSRVGQTVLENYGNTATMGYLPHLQAGAEKLRSGVSSLFGIGPEGVDADLRKQGFQIDQPESSYLSERDDNLRRQKELALENPAASKVGTGLGIAGSALIGAKLMPGAAPAATVGGRLGQAAKAGAAYGALSNPGDSEGVIAPVQPMERLTGAAIGGAAGAAVQGSFDAAGAMGRKFSDYLRDKATERAAKTIGGTPTQIEKLKDTGQYKEIGGTLLDEGAVPWFGSTGRIAKRVDALKEKAGADYGKILDQVDAQKVEFTPIKIKNPKKMQVVQEEIRATPIRFDENPIKRAFPNLRPEDAPPTLVRGNEQPIQMRMLERPKASVVAGEPKTKPLVTVDTAAAAKSVKPKFANAANTPGSTGLAQVVDDELAALVANGKLTLRESQALRQRIDKNINWAKKTGDLKGNQEVLYEIRTALRDEMNKAVNSVPHLGIPKDQLIQQGRRYGNLEQASDLLERKLAREAGNRTVSLTDTIAAGSGIAAGGGPMLAAAAGALNKGIRTYGNAVGARSMNAASKLFAKAPGLTEVAAKNPVLINRLEETLRGNPKFDQSAPDPFDDPEIRMLIEQNPQLIDLIKDPMRRKIAKERFGGRDPASK